MRPTIASTLALALLSTSACRRLRRHHPARHASAAVHWFTWPAQGIAARVDASRFFRGAVRVEDGHAASAPWPAAAIAAVAHVENAWLFACEDGSLYRAPTFTGRLTSIGGLSSRVAPLESDGAVAAVRPRSEGGLFIVDAQRDAWAVDASGHARKLPLTRVRHGVFASPTEAFAVVEP